MMAVLLLLLLLQCAASAQATQLWGVMLDCGSSGTRAHIYQWAEGDPSTVEEFVPTGPAAKLLAIKPGISAFADNVTGLLPYLAPLLHEAVRWVPLDARPDTRIRAYATAGMRLLTEEAQAPIWQAVGTALNGSGLVFEAGDARTASGNFEGLWNWMAIRFILEKAGRLGKAGDGAGLLGGLDLGGASTQITFSPPLGVITQDAYTVSGDRLYSHSYMRYGQDQAVLRLARLLAPAPTATRAATQAAATRLSPPPTTASVEVAALPVVASPCLNKGYALNVTYPCGDAATPGDFAAGGGGGGGAECSATLVGAAEANWTACRDLSTTLVNNPTVLGECLLAPCAADGVYQPTATGVHFYAVSAYWYLVSEVGLADCAPPSTECQVSWQDIEKAGQAFCAKPWDEVGTNSNGDTCFMSAYVPALLEAYGIAPDATDITYVDTVVGYQVTWALGAQLYTLDAKRFAVALA